MNEHDAASEQEEEMLKRLEARYSLPAEEESPFRSLPVWRAEVIRGTHFLSYLNEGRIGGAWLPEELSGAPLLLYSEKNRFLALCRSLMLDWRDELDELVALILEAEQGVDHDVELQTFGLQVRDDCYIYGYAGMQPVFASKDLLLSIFQFVGDSGSGAESLPAPYRTMCAKMLVHVDSIRGILQ